MADAPADFVAAQVKGIVGIEVEIAAIEGKWKDRRNRPAADRRRRGGAEGRGIGEMAALVEGTSTKP